MPSRVIDSGEKTPYAFAATALSSLTPMPALISSSARPKLLSRLAWVTVKLALTAAIFEMILRHQDFGTVISRAAAVGPACFAMACVVAMLQIPLAGLRWREIVRTVRASGEPVPSFLVIQTITFGAQIVSQILPFVAGDAIRATLLMRTGTPTATAVKSTILDRGVGAIVLVALVPAAILGSQSVRHSFAPVALTIVALCLMGAAAVAFLQRNAKRKPFGRGLNRLAIARYVWKFGDDLRRVALESPGNVRIVSAAVLVHALSVAIFADLAVGLALGDHLTAIVALAPLIVLASMMPFAFGGWGVREGFAIFALQRAGVDPASALALSLAFGAALLVASLPGAIAFLFVPDGDAIAIEGRGAAP